MPITTSGDERRPRHAGVIADKSRFVKEIEEALLARRDRPGRAFGEGRAGRAAGRARDRGRAGARGPARRALRRGLARRPRGGCGGGHGEPAPARRLLLAVRPDLDVRELRGNVDTRLRRLADGDFDAIVLAQAGLDRLGRGDEGSPARPGGVRARPRPGLPRARGARRDDPAGSEPARGSPTRAHSRSSAAERSRGPPLDATCHTPIGAYAVTDGETLTPHRVRRPAGRVALDPRRARPMPYDAASARRRPAAARGRAAGRRGRGRAARRGRAGGRRRIAFSA